jgi:preprotein translocase subunit YajC
VAKFKFTTLVLIGVLLIGLLLTAGCATGPVTTTTTGIYVTTTTGTTTSLTTGVITALPATTTGIVNITTTGTTAVTTTGTATVPQTFWSQWGILIFIVVIFGLMYLLMIRPQRKRQKEQQKMTSELQKGDDVMTTSGIYGRIESIDENTGTIVLKLESGATIRVVRNAVTGKRARE